MKFYLLSTDELAFLTSNARTYQDSDVVLAIGHQLSKIPPLFYVDKVQENSVNALRDADVSYNSHNKKINRRNCTKVNELMHILTSLNTSVMTAMGRFYHVVSLLNNRKL